MEIYWWLDMRSDYTMNIINTWIATMAHSKNLASNKRLITTIERQMLNTLNCLYTSQGI